MTTTEVFSPDAILEALDAEQRAVAEATSGPVCVLAGAGTGKTRAITHRVAYAVHAGLYPAQQVLMVTFTARAAGEMRTRLRELGVAGAQARTFHAAALRQLSYFWPQVVGGPLPQLVEHKAPLVADAVARLRLQADRAALRDLAAEIEWAKVSLVTPARYGEVARRAGRGQPGGFDLPTVARLLEIYEDVKGDRDVIDFEDVLLLTVGVLEEHPRVAEAVRSQYRQFVVDEYQDVNELQQRLLGLWLGGREDLCVVGDPSQTIYSFTGASPRHLLEFTGHHPGSRLVELVRDYRSTPQVVGLANALLAKGGPAVSGGRRPLTLVAQRPPGPAPRLVTYEDDVAEAAGIAGAVKRLVAEGVRPREIAVLFRTNAQSAPLEQAFADAGLTYVLRGGERFFNRKEVRDAVLLLRGAARGGDGAGEESLGEQTRAVLSSAGWSPAPPESAGALRERWDALQALALLADELAQTRPEATLADLVAELEERAASQHAPAVEGVTLASLHAAKGLEWDAVFLAGLSEGLMPISFAEGVEAVEEERRLLYVGITRAREHLTLSFARARTPGGRASRVASRFLDGLLAGAGNGSGNAGSGGGRGGASSRGSGPDTTRPRRSSLPSACRVCRRPLESAAERKIGRCDDCPPGYQEAVFERLREWRATTAAAAKAPAFVVFTDATLVAIAETAPSDHAELARIPGVGAAKLARYGDEVLEVIAG